jgi:hypothetical protein
MNNCDIFKIMPYHKIIFFYNFCSTAHYISALNLAVKCVHRKFIKPRKYSDGLAINQRCEIHSKE